MPARIFASSRRLTLLTAGAALALTTACGANTAEVPRTVPSAQETTSATASAEATASPTATGATPADVVESTDAETSAEETPAEEAPVEEPAEPEAETQEPAEEEASAEVPAPDNQLGEGETTGETGARQDTEQTITDTEEQPALANPAEETQQPTDEVQELDDEGAVFYETCEAAAAEGVFNILEGTAGYRIELDEDGNGVACEG